MVRQLRPASLEAAAAAMAGAVADGDAVRIVGGATKLGWGAIGADAGVELHTTALDRIVEHNEGDLTAVLEAGTPLESAQMQFAAAGQMLALDPTLGPDHRATIGGVFATGDSGPLQHRYGAPRDLILGMTVALSDGTVARSGGKVIKNVAGYDLAKLFCGSFGTLGLILRVSVRLHPLPAATATALGVAVDPNLMGRAVRALAASPLELEALDVAWRGGRGGVLAQCGGTQARRRAERAGTAMRAAGLGQVEVVADDAELWARQRAGQRSSDAVIVRIAARPSELARVLRAADACGGTLVGRAALGRNYLELEPDGLGRLAEHLPRGASVVLLDAPRQTREAVAPWGPLPPAPLLTLMRNVKARFDPAHACNPGVFVGGI
jgi:glycolate oxidase FAD binding subunit